MKKLRKTFSLFNLFLTKMAEDNVSAYAAQASFFTIVSFFPFCMFLMTLLQFSSIQERDFTRLIIEYAPSALSPFILQIITEIYNSPTMTVLSITVVATLWAASKAFHSLIYGLNSVYNIPENRNFFFLRFLATIYTIVFAVLLLVTLLILGFGNSITYAINNLIPSLQDTTLLLISIRASVALSILIFYFLFLFLVVPNRKSHILYELPGAIFTAIGWIGFSYLYSDYIDHFSNFSNTYGSLTAVVLLMLWVYFCMYMLLIGGEINDCIRRAIISKKLITKSHNQQKESPSS